MSEIEKQYTNGDITVIWKPGICTHSTNCWNGLHSVFQPKSRPWVDMNGASTDEIIAQIEKCPSGALSWKRNGENP